MFKDFFYFSKRERQGIVILAVLIAGIFVGKWFFSEPKSDVLEEGHVVGVPDAQGGATAKFVPLPQSAPKRHYPDNGAVSHTPKSSATTPQTRTFYARDRDTIVRPTPQSDRPKVEKFSKGEMLELNAADTTELKKIPGVGTSFAKRIVAYRKLLGGYHRVEQLQEVYGMYVELYEQIVPYIHVDDASITRLSVNKTSIDQLRNHPYLNFYQAKAILETRKKRGKLQGIENLQLLDEFSADDWVRIAPYLDFQ
ncbi:hypothetical protein AGMMS49525_07370 [Bacteroidia bacterium]|nr:hypothetical protein AGMMS49525_07370 [Bacteroidia bacterium]